MKKFHKSAVATGLTLALGFGFASQASAYIYAGSRLMVDNLAIGIISADGSGANVAINQFDFFTTATAHAVGLDDTSEGHCSGHLTGTPGTNCGNSADGDPVLYPGIVGTVVGSGAANAGIVRPERTITYLGPNGADVSGDWASSDAVIESATLVDAAYGNAVGGTEANQISEARLESTEAASASSRISSTTLMSLSFTLDGPGVMQISMDALVGTFAEFFTSLDTPEVVGATASSHTTFSITLTGANGDGFIWKPTFGTTSGAGGCGILQAANLAVSGTVLCLDEATPETLQLTSTAYSLPDSSNAKGGEAYSAYSMLVLLNGGDYSLALKATTDATTTRRAVPEPSTLLLFGLGMTGLATLGRRRRKQLKG